MWLWSERNHRQHDLRRVTCWREGFLSGDHFYTSVCVRFFLLQRFSPLNVSLLKGGLGRAVGEQTGRSLDPGGNCEFWTRLCSAQFSRSLCQSVPVSVLDQQPDHQQPAGLRHLQVHWDWRWPQCLLCWPATTSNHPRSNNHCQTWVPAMSRLCKHSSLSLNFLLGKL